jgi:hypothetical protein
MRLRSASESSFVALDDVVATVQGIIRELFAALEP